MAANQLQPSSGPQEHYAHCHHHMQNRHRRQSFAHEPWQERPIADQHL
jgi:hypothetical protein